MRSRRLPAIQVYLGTRARRDSVGGGDEVTSRVKRVEPTRTLSSQGLLYFSPPIASCSWRGDRPQGPNRLRLAKGARSSSG
jgi:hypothetical protein